MASDNKSSYEIVAERIASHLDAGPPAWADPFVVRSGLPRNAVSGRNYSGMNVLLLWIAAANGGYSDPRWLTFRQAKGLGGSVRKGEKSSVVTFYREYKRKNDTDGDAPRRAMRLYRVFNVSQCDGLDVEPWGVADPVPMLDGVQRVTDSTGAAVRWGASVAAYHPPTDEILMPDSSAFACSERLASTLLHELGHWTGHGSRLAREGVTAPVQHGSARYAREELVAELCSAFVCASMGLDTSGSASAYAESWLRPLGGDRRELFAAVRGASAAAEFLLRGVAL